MKSTSIISLTTILSICVACNVGASDLKAVHAKTYIIDFPEVSNEKSVFNNYKKLDPKLVSLSLQSSYKSLDDLTSKALSLNIPFDNGQVSVALSVADGEDLSQLENQIDTIGGEVSITSNGVVYASVPASSLSQLENVTALGYAKAQAMSYPSSIKVLSEGVKQSRVLRLHKEGIKGEGIKVGIIDWGYRHYSRLQEKGELPQPVKLRAFNRSNDVISKSVHGTACAEIIHDMAPEAKLYLATIDGRDDQIISAAKWLADQGVDIISFSGGGHSGPINGMANLDLLVDEIVNKHGILWVNAAGNEGQQHWMGNSVDHNNNSLIDIPKTNNNDLVLMEVKRTSKVNILLSWDDWGSNPRLPSPNQNLDLFLAKIDRNTSKLIPIFKSDTPQNGRGEPMESISERLNPGVYAVGIRATNVSKKFKVHLNISGATIYPVNTSGSIGIPATSQSALAVGAVDVRNAKLELFSSQGPTDDGRLKPEVTAPDHNLSLAYGKNNRVGRFPGTSAACPHVSGFAALLKQINQTANVHQLKNLVIKNVREKGIAGPDNAFGYGHIDASNIKITQARPPSQDNPDPEQINNGDLFSPIEDMLK